MPRLKPPPGRTAAATIDPALETTEPDEDVLQEEQVASPPDASAALQEQIDALRKSEQAARERADQLARDREEAIKRARDREAEITDLRKQNIESQTEAVSSALAAAQADAEAAERDLENAISIGDAKAQAEAQRRLAKAETNIARLEDGKVELEKRVKEQAAQPVQETSNDPLEKVNLPGLAKDWLRAHPDYLTDARKNAKIQSLHWDVVDEGHEPFSRSYFDSMEQHLGMRAKPQVNNPVDEEIDEPQPRTRTPMVSAPVSRDSTPSAEGTDRPGRVTLTQAQKEAAKIAGISEAEYAKGILRLKTEKLNGNYGGAP